MATQLYLQRALVASASTLLAVSCCAPCNDAAKKMEEASVGKTLHRPKGTVAKPFFVRGPKVFHGGRTFAIKVRNKTVFLTSLGIVGPRIGLPKPVAAADIPATCTPFVVSDKTVSLLSDAYVLWDQIKGHHERQGPGVMHGLVAANEALNGLLEVTLDSDDVDFSKAQGSPVVNGAGELIGVTTGWKKSETVLVATPASRFMSALRRDVENISAGFRTIEGLHKNVPKLKEPKVGLPSPIHTVDRKDYAGGTAFLATVGKTPVILSAHQLIGPTVGISKPVLAKDLSTRVTRWGYKDAKGKTTFVPGKYVPIEDVAERWSVTKGPGDILAYVPEKPPSDLQTPLKIREKPLKYPAHVYLMWSGVADQMGKKQGRLLHGVATRERGKVMFVEVKSKLKLKGSAGAPVVDKFGQLVGILVGDRFGRLQVNPVSRFLPALKSSLAKAK